MSVNAQTRPRNRGVSRKKFTGLFFMLPFLVIFVAIFIGPLAYSGYLSLFRSQLIGGQTFAGLANYIRVFGDPSFWSGVTNVLRFLVIAVPFHMAISLALALVFDLGRVGGARFGRLAIFLPFAVPAVIGTMMWQFIYRQETGLIAQTFNALGLTSPDLLSSQWFLAALINIPGWEFIGYNMIIFYAALRAVPRELFEAAAIDGASEWRIAWHVKIPAIRGALLLVAVFSIIYSFQLFTEPALLKNGPASTVVGTDYTPNIYAYSVAFQNQDLTYAAAIAFVLALATLIPSAVVLRLFTQKEDLR